MNDTFGHAAAGGAQRDRWFDRRLAGAVLLTAVAYYAGAYISIALRAPPGGIATIWLPNAILLAALLLAPFEKWWWYLLAVLPAHVHVVAAFQPNAPLPVIFAQFGGNVLQVLLAASILRGRKLTPPRFDNVRALAWYILVAAVVAPGVATTFTVYAFLILDFVPEYWLAWQRRMLTNAVPALAVTPLIVLATGNVRSALGRMTAQKWLELGALMALLVSVGTIAFGWQNRGTQILAPLLYATLPLLLWAAVRFGLATLSICILIVTGLSLAYSYMGRGPFVTLASAGNVLSLQGFLIAISVPVMLLSAVMRERQNTEDALRESKERYSMATAAGSVGVWDWDLVTNRIYTDGAIKAMLGLAENDVLDTFGGWSSRVHPDDSAESRGLAEAHIRGETDVFVSEHRVFHKDGSIRWFLARGVVVERVHGRAMRMLGTTTDITERKRAEEAVRRSNKHVRRLAGRLIAAQEEERRRIARDLHDDLNQSVAALCIRISHALRLRSTSVEVAEQLKEIQAIAATLSDDIRGLSHAIHPATLEHAGLASALTSFAAEIRRLEHVDVELLLPEIEERVPHEVAIGVYRVVQESIRNVVRHSGAKHAQVVLAVGPDTLTLQVKDDGRGFDVERVRQAGGLGLISIEERVRLLNGRLELVSRAGHGTALRVEIPICDGAPAPVA